MLPCEDGVFAPDLLCDKADRGRVSVKSPISPEVEITNSDWCSHRAPRPIVLGVMLAMLLLQELTLLLRRVETEGPLSFSPLPVSQHNCLSAHMLRNSNSEEAGERTRQRTYCDSAGVGTPQRNTAEHYMQPCVFVCVLRHEKHLEKVDHTRPATH